MTKFFTTAIVAAILGLSQQAGAQFVIQDDSTFNTKAQLLLANELFESGEPFAEELGYNLDNLDPMVKNTPDTISYTTGIENYEYSRYILGTLTARSSLGLNMMWSPVVVEKSAMMDSTFDGMFTGGMTNGYKEDDMLMMMMQMFGNHANQTPPANAYPQFADFAYGNMVLDQAVANNFQMDFGTIRWNRSKMDKTLNLGAMGQSMWKQYFWAQDMLSAFHDGNDNGIDANGIISPDSAGSPNFDPNNNVYYGGNNLDGYIGQVLTAVSINKTKLLMSQLAYDGTNLGMVNPATYNPANGIQYFPTKIAVTESQVMTGLPPKATAFAVTDATSQLFDQISFLLATTGFKNMMNPNDSSDAAHLAYKSVFDGNPFPNAMSATGTAGPYDLMMGISKVIFLNLNAMHYNSTEKTFVDEASLTGGQVVMGSTISAENAAYIIQVLAQFSDEFTGTPLKTMADAQLIAQADYILSSFVDVNGGFYNSFTIGVGASNSAKTLAANGALIKGLYTAYEATGDMTYLNAANSGYNYLINNFYQPSVMAFRTTMGDTSAIYNPWNLAILSGALRQAKLVGNQSNSPAIYGRVFKSVYNKMILAEAEQTGETGSDSDGDGVAYIAGGHRPFVFANKGVLQIISTGISNTKNNNISINIYPNPTTDYFNLNLEVENTSNVDISIYDISGKKVANKSIGNVNGLQKIKVPVSSLSSGNYIVRVSINNEPIAIEKLIVQ
jgi:hypothetical protein